jgi:hypothetical protein
MLYMSKQFLGCRIQTLTKDGQWEDRQGRICGWGRNSYDYIRILVLTEKGEIQDYIGGTGTNGNVRIHPDDAQKVLQRLCDSLEDVNFNSQ